MTFDTVFRKMRLSRKRVWARCACGQRRRGVGNPLFRILGMLLCLCGTAYSGTAGEPQTDNLFVEWLGQSEEAVRAKLESAWEHFFEGDPESERLYYPVGDDSAYIHDIASDDVRSEGISYGMMIAVQMDRQEAFDRLWQWAYRHMRHDSGPLEGYFAWHATTEGVRLSEGPASDGEEWIAMALYFAAGRWGNGAGIFDYETQANELLGHMLHKPQVGRVISIFDRCEKMVRFVPNVDYAKITDPSYHLPAFYEQWARWASADNEFWAAAAEVSREHFKDAAHPGTGLMPDYAYFDGTPRVQDGHEDFRFDAWRVIQNVALDHAWWGRDPWQVEQSNRILGFLGRFGEELPNQFQIDGTPLSEESSPGLFAMAAVGGLAADRALAEPFVRRLWELEPPVGYYRYYDGLLYYLALLQVSGEFRVYPPAATKEGNGSE